MVQERRQHAKAGCPNSSRMFTRDGRDGGGMQLLEAAMKSHKDTNLSLLAPKVRGARESMFKARFEEEISDLMRQEDWELTEPWKVSFLPGEV